MRFLHNYITQFRDEGSIERSQLADLLQATKSQSTNSLQRICRSLQLAG